MTEASSFFAKPGWILLKGVGRGRLTLKKKKMQFLKVVNHGASSRSDSVTGRNPMTIVMMMGGGLASSQWTLAIRAPGKGTFRYKLGEDGRSAGVSRRLPRCWVVCWVVS